MFIINSINNERELQTFIVLCITFLGTIFWVYRTYFTTVEADIILNDIGIIKNNKTIYWNDIHSFGTIGHNPPSIVLLTYSTGVESINTFQININIDEILEIIDINVSM